MANQVKNYYLAPSTDYPPNGLLALGNIILSPKRPVPPLAQAATKPTPQVSSHKANYAWTRDRSSAFKLGIWAKFIELVSLDVSTDVARTRKEVYSFESMHTEEFFPDDDYVRAMMDTPSVKHYLERQLFTKSVYMIVGIKAVTGAKVKTIVTSANGGKLGAGFDFALVGGPPVALGPDVEGRVERGDEVEWADEKGFVFAFRVRKVRIRGPDEVTQTDYNRNTLLGRGDEEDERSSELAVDVPGLEHVGVGAGSVREHARPGFAVDGLEDVDAVGSEFQLEEHVVGEEEEEVSVCAL